MKKALLILLGSLLLSSVFFINTGSTLIGDGGDSYEFFGFMHLAKENILAFKHPFTATDTLRYPNGFDFSYGYDGAFAVLSGAFISIFTNPILAYNITVVLILFLNIYISYIYFKKTGILFGKESNIEIKAIISALIFGASPYVFARLNSHLNLAFVAGFPALMFYAILLYHKITHYNDHFMNPKQRVTQGDINLIFASVLVIAMGSLQYLLMLSTVVFMLLIIIESNDFYKKIVIFARTTKKEIFTSLAIFIVIFIYLFGGYLAAMLRESITFVNPYDKFLKPAFLDFIIPNGYLGDFWAFINHSEISIERVITIGAVEIVLFIILMIKLRDKKIRLLGGALLMLYAILGSGLFTLPYLPEGGRFVILLSLFIGFVFVAFDGWFKNTLVFSFILTMLLIERLFFNLQVAKPVAAGVLYEKVRGLPGEAVLNIPLSKFNAYRSALPVFYNKKVLDGYFHYTAATPKSEAFFAHRLYSRFTCSDERSDSIVYDYEDIDRVDLINSLKTDKIGVLVMFKDGIVGRIDHDGCQNVKDWWSWLEPETLSVSKDTRGVTKKTFEIAGDNPYTIVRIFFERGGKYLINGFYVSPETFNNMVVVLPDGNEVPVEFKELGEGFQAEFDPPIEINAKAGDFVYIKSPSKFDTNRYIDIFYLFSLDKTTLTRATIPLEIIYKDNDVEIYKVN